jgi:hypothetical protein
MIVQSWPLDRAVGETSLIFLISALLSLLFRCFAADISLLLDAVISPKRERLQSISENPARFGAETPECTCTGPGSVAPAPGSQQNFRFNSRDL